MIRRLDALGVVACFGILNGTTCDGSGYDALNRPTKKSYSTPAGVSPTPTVVSCYDGQTYSGGACTGSLVAAELGQLTSVGNTQSSTDYAHDMAGRLVASTQRTAGLDDRPFTYRHFAGDAGGFGDRVSVTRVSVTGYAIPKLRGEPEDGKFPFRAVSAVVKGDGRIFQWEVRAEPVSLSA